MSTIANLCKFRFLSLSIGMKFVHSLKKGIKTPNNKIVPPSKKFCWSNRAIIKLQIENSSLKIQNSCILAKGENIPKKRRIASIAEKIIVINK